MSDILPSDERVLITLTAAEWITVLHAISKVYGPNDQTYTRIRLALVSGN